MHEVRVQSKGKVVEYCTRELNIFNYREIVFQQPYTAESSSGFNLYPVLIMSNIV